MKIAYLIISHNNLLHLERLVSSLNCKDADFYIHFDKKTNKILDFQKHENVYVLENRFSVNWGGFSIVNATIELIKSAFVNKIYDRYVLLSGADYPIQSNTFIHDFFNYNQEKNFINVKKMPTPDKPLDRVNYFFIEGGKRNKSIKGKTINAFNKLIQLTKIKRNYPARFKGYQLYGGSQWWAFNQQFVKYLVGFLKDNQDFVSFYKRTLIPDEMFFQTIIMNSPYKTTVNDCLTYKDWSIGEPPYPSLITTKHLNEMYGESKYLFARKFNDESSEIIKIIDSKIKQFDDNLLKV